MQPSYCGPTVWLESYLSYLLPVVNYKTVKTIRTGHEFLYVSAFGYHYCPFYGIMAEVLCKLPNIFHILT